MADALTEAKENPAVRVVDVRSRQEYMSGHIPGAINLPLEDYQQAQSLLPDKQAPIYLYCASGARSGMAAGMLKRLGYEQSANIGGIYSYNGTLEK